MLACAARRYSLAQPHMCAGACCESDPLRIAGLLAASILEHGDLELSNDMQAIERLSSEVPQYTKAWLTWSPSWQAFQTDFLKLWGGRYGPALKHGDWWLWFTSIYLHRDLQHIVSNMLLFVAMSVHLELNYGWWRLLLVWIMSGVTTCDLSTCRVSA